jgi:hypothetical protein
MSRETFLKELENIEKSLSDPNTRKAIAESNFPEKLHSLEEKKNELLKELMEISDAIQKLASTLKLNTKVPTANATTVVKSVRLRDPHTGNIYKSYAEACRRYRINYANRSAHRAWIATMTYDLENIE